MKQALNFTGTGVAIVTPFTSKGAIDFLALTKLVEHLIKGRVEYIVVLGTTGETATLSKEEKQQVIAHIVKTNKKRIPLVLGVGGNNTAELVEQLKKDDLSDFDAILSVSGRLDVTAGGPGIATHLTDFMQGRGRQGSGPLDGNGRRSIYLTTWRNFLSPMMMAFDAPTPFNTMGRRSVSNVPAQALILMNDPFVIEQAKLWANRALSGSQNTAEQRISRMYHSAFARPPSEAEAAAVLAFLTGHDQDEHTWADLAHVLINSKEFIYIN